MPAPETVPLLYSPHQRSGTVVSSVNRSQGGHAAHLDVDEALRLAQDSVVRDDAGQPYELSVPVTSLAKLGTGVSLYFFFVYFYFFLLAIIFAMNFYSGAIRAYHFH